MSHHAMSRTDLYGDFEVLAHGGTYKAAMGVIGQPKYGEKLQRDEKGAPSERFASREEDEVNVIQTLRTGRECAIGVRGSFSEGAQFVGGCIRHSFQGNKDRPAQV